MTPRAGSLGVWTHWLAHKLSWLLADGRYHLLIAGAWYRGHLLLLCCWTWLLGEGSCLLARAWLLSGNTPEHFFGSTWLLLHHRTWLKGDGSRRLLSEVPTLLRERRRGLDGRGRAGDARPLLTSWCKRLAEEAWGWQHQGEHSRLSLQMLRHEWPRLTGTLCCLRKEAALQEGRPYLPGHGRPLLLLWKVRGLMWQPLRRHRGQRWAQPLQLHGRRLLLDHV